jgi:uncharacterized membrane protein
MPPLCTAGFGLASGNFNYFLGAAYLFFINCLFIMLATYISVKYFKFRQMEYEDQAVGRRTKRVSTFLIVLFIVPSIWSAVTLIRQNNFEDNATAFVEDSKAYGRSIIYDYKIDHTDGSTLELFFTGEALSEDMKAAIFNKAADFGIDSSQIIINDHSSTANDNNIELVKGIYDKMDSEIGKRDEDIRRLQEELKAAKGTDIPYVQLTKEIASVYPEVKEVQLAQGAKVSTDSLSLTKSMFVMIKTDSLLSSTQQERLEQWLKTRLDTEEMTLIINN